LREELIHRYATFCRIFDDSASGICNGSVSERNGEQSSGFSSRVIPHTDA